MNQQTSEIHQKSLRPRSLRAHIQVLDAAVELLADRGIEGTSVDAIAAASGVSKATIYKHWPDKDALCLEAIGRVFGIDGTPLPFDSGDLLQDFIDVLSHKPPEDTAGLRERLTPHIIAYAARYPEFGHNWRARVTEPGRTKLVELMKRGIDQGIFPPDLDLTLGLALLLGPIMYKHVFGKVSPMPENLGEGAARAFWRAFALSPDKPHRKTKS